MVSGGVVEAGVSGLRPQPLDAFTDGIGVFVSGDRRAKRRRRRESDLQVSERAYPRTI